MKNRYILLHFFFTGVSFFACVGGCNNKPPLDNTQDPDLPSTYRFTSKFNSKSSVSYSGQTMRQALIASLKSEIGRIATGVQDNSLNPADADEVKARLTKFYEFDSNANGSENHSIASNPSALQKTFNDISTDKDLKSKAAGQDSQTHWGSAKTVVGWGGSNLTPDQLIDRWFDELAGLCHRRSTTIENDPQGNVITRCYVTATGLDYQQLLEKFILGALTFSQATGDYLDDAPSPPNKGLLSNNTEAVAGKSYTELEHGWDESFGYFGAARDYGNYSDADIKAGTNKDVDGDGKIDLTSEYNFAASVNAGKRDNGGKRGRRFYE